MTVASVVVCAYTIDRWSDLQAAVASVLAQEPPAAEIVVVVDHNQQLLERARTLWAPMEPEVSPRVWVVPNTGVQGLSGARNSGVEACTSEVVAFLDDDAEAEPGWLASLLAQFANPHVAACGGAAVAALVKPRPVWWPVEFDWVVGCSYLGLPTGTSDVRNLIGANMAVRRAMVVELKGFHEGIGRVGTKPSGCEETDLFIRLVQRWPDARIVYEPTARVRHTVPSSRLSWRYFRSRCFAEGMSKAAVARRVGSERALASERSYVARVLPRGMAKGLAGVFRREPGAGRRAVAIAAGLGLTTAGYLAAQLGAGP